MTANTVAITETNKAGFRVVAEVTVLTDGEAEQLKDWAEADGYKADIRETSGGEYNGWSNRETWAANLHLSNDETLYTEAREVAGQDEHGDALQEWIDKLADEVFDTSSSKPFTDFGNAQMSDEVKMMIREIGSLWRVNWRELRASLTEE